ncbi:hypothetical protein CASFOL_039356 [Castilleja foliolosa]|uniref:Exonuclease 1 n=1 Tax=Castilleja foliolosa TaxID=1961234 RepID=A0ABD3BI59_9LAMI
MGIQGLLPLLKSIMNPIHIKELEGCCVAVDTYSWLHKGAFSCSTDLCKGQPTSKHIDYCMNRVNMLRHYGVKPVLVFDGGHLPMKGDQEIKRARSRKENLSRALEHEANGNRSAAYECFQKAVDISPSVAYDLIQVLKKENVSYVVAPYEADAQMTFLALDKRVDAVITEDSDLIAFGCPRIIYKMDKFGQGVEFKNEMLKYNKELNLAEFNQTMLLEMCILSGCDYLPSLPGMGLKKAHTLIKKFKNHENVIKHLKYSNIEVSPLYEESFKKAILTFKHQRVYDPVSEEIVHLSEPEAQGIARGDLDPFTKLPIQGESIATEKVINGTYQLKNFKPDGEKKKLDLPAQKNLLTNYFCFASLEAKRKFRAPRITPNRPTESKGNSGHLVHEVKHGAKNDDHGKPERGIERIPFNVRENSVCKPCVLLHKDLESDQETGKQDSRNKKVVVRSSYFTKKHKDENGMENKTDESELDEGNCRNEEKRIDIRSLYFREKNTENDNCEGQNGKLEHSIDNRKNRVRSSYIEEIYVDEDNNNNSLDCTTKKRKIAQIDSTNEDANDIKWSSGSCTSDLEEETNGREEMLASNISHLGRYSDISEKSMDKFVSKMSSFRYGSTGSRASGLRAPLKEIKDNICMKTRRLMSI